MALFNKQNLKSVVLIEKKGDDSKYQPIATGVIIGFPINTEEPDLAKRKYNIFLLTNRHVFNEQIELWIRFDRKDENNTTRFSIILREGQENRWLAHPDSAVDLAMVTINPQVLDDNGVDWGFANEEIFAYFEKFSEIGIELGDAVFLAGFPMGISGSLRNYAIVRSGTIARIDQEIIDSTKSFLIDATVFPGNSGGPVFLKPELASLVNTIAVNSIYLVGIISGYKIYQELLYSHQTNPPSIAGVSVENSGLATVVPMNFVKEIYNNFINQNKTLEKEIKGENKITDTQSGTVQASK